MRVRAQEPPALNFHRRVEKQLERLGEAVETSCEEAFLDLRKDCRLCVVVDHPGRLA